MTPELPVQDGLSTVTFDVSEETFLAEMGMDHIEAMMSEGTPVECPVEHLHYPGLYVRRIFMPAGTLVASMIHRTEHPFVILQGDVSVWNASTRSIVRFRGPCDGRTTPGTRRLLYIHEDTVWQTYHCRDDKETVEDIERRITEPHFNPLVGKTHSEMHHIASHENLVLHND